MVPPLSWWWIMELKKTLRFFFSSLHASWKLFYSLRFSTYMKMVNRILSYRPVTIFFVQDGGRVPFILWVKFWFLNDQFLPSALTAKIATFQMQITQLITMVRYYFSVPYRWICVWGFRIFIKIGNWFTNEGATAISVRDVFNKNIVNFS